MKLNILLKTTDCRGDHSTEIAVAYEVNSGETVMELSERLLGLEATGDKKVSDWIEIRRIEEDPEDWSPTPQSNWQNPSA